MSEDNKYLYLNRVVSGRLQKFKFTLDANYTILSEEPCHADGTLLNTHNNEPGTVNPTAMQLKQRGYEFHIRKPGQHLIEKVPQKEVQIAQFFVPDAPCPFQGCEALRKAYLDERRVLEEQHDGKCPACESGSLQRKYRTIIEAHIDPSTFYDDQVSKVSSKHPAPPRPKKEVAVRTEK